MKKIITIFCLAALLSFMTGCGSDTNNISGESENNSIVTNNSSVNSVKPVNFEETPVISQPQIPAGEPTFLTAPDGVPIYTSEISEVYTGDEEWDYKELITFERAEQLAHDGGSFTVKCEGFAYGYIPAKAFNREENPELFRENGRESFEYLGEMSHEKSGYNKYPVELTRFKAGDKFGDLTIKNAYTLFKNNKRELDFSGMIGAHIGDGYIEFDGELELAGYINVTPMETLYGSGGDMTFLPNGESSTKLPGLYPVWDPESGEYSSIATKNHNGYLGDWTLDLGNMYEVNCDTSGLQPGDNFVKVKIVLENIKYTPGQLPGGFRVELKSIEVL